ncbi:MAG TPA: EAL domain-containing protein [Epulopiscium sp.]|nr:EAL domain-containing protein [Candidatus Epulonipiscium sp.]
MEYIAPILSVIFTLLIFIYLLLGTYIIRLNPKSSLNRLFLAVCIAMSIWSLGFAIGITAQGPESALLWRRVSAIGWTMVYSIILHFLILLTYENRTLNNKGLLKFLYIPGFISIYIFSFSNHMAAAQHNLQKLTYGWVNMPINNTLDWFFYAYYTLYAVVGLVVIWKWKQKLEDKKLAKQGTLIMLSFIASFILGSLVDIGVGSILAKPLPQLAPVFILLPTWTMYYGARYYGAMGQEKSYSSEMIVTEEDQEKIFKNIARALLLGGLISFISEYIPFIRGNDGDIKGGILKGGLFSMVGFGVYMFQRIKKTSVKEALTIITLVLSIPIIMFATNDYGGLTVWAFPIVIMMSSLIFSNRTLLISSTVIAIITQRLMWILNPEVTVLIDQYDYIARIGVFATAFLIGYYVNRIYIAKIKENNAQIAFQKINSEVSLEFVNVNQENLDTKINKLLLNIGAFFQIDRAYIFLVNHQSNTMTYSYEWCAEGIEPEVGKVEEAPVTICSWGFEQLKKNKVVHIDDISAMPPEARAEQEQLMRQKVKTFVTVAIGKDNDIDGFIGFESLLSHKKWSEEEIKQIGILSNLIAQGLAKIKDEKEIEYMAYYDTLTTLPNRFLFKDRTNQGIRLAKKNGKQAAVLFLDLDDFKAVNDTIGHKGGDELLKEVANKLRKSVGKTDTVARFGGDEFMILLNDINNEEDIFKVVDLIMALFGEPFNIQGQDFLVTSSVGIAVYPGDGEEADLLIENADMAMYKAKEKGKNQYTVYTTKMKEEVEMNIILSNDLSSAIERNELVVYYQPQVDIVSGRINGLEALLRWEHPEKGMISPGVFIPLAEKNGLINSIGEWVLRTACIQTKKWQDMNLPPLRMAVNLSAIQLISPSIVNLVKDILKESNLASEYLEIEITESAAIKESIYIEEALAKLKNIGVTIAIDDFGTEYSSLSRLKLLPIDRIKIDMQFTQGIESNEKDRAIIMVIINLAKNLGLNVIAEGVETKGQLDFLNQKLCDDVQGYYYYKPMPMAEVEEVLREQSLAFAVI